jgi:GNAT superfamily N-acetyltransferase
MRLRKSCLWGEPQIIGAIVRNLFILDPTVLLGNPVVYYLEQRGTLVSFIAIKRRLSVYELKSVYTFPQYRGKNYMSFLMRLVIKKYPNLILICKTGLKTFYERFRFRKTQSGPAFLRFEQCLANFFIPFKKARLILMKRTTR